MQAVTVPPLGETAPMGVPPPSPPSRTPLPRRSRLNPVREGGLPGPQALSRDRATFRWFQSPGFLASTHLEIDQTQGLQNKQEYAILCSCPHVAARSQLKNGIARRRKHAKPRHYPQVLARPGGGAEAYCTIETPQRPSLEITRASPQAARSISGGIGRCSVAEAE